MKKKAKNIIVLITLPWCTMYIYGILQCTLMVQLTVMVQCTVHLWYSVKWSSSLLYIDCRKHSDGPVNYSLLLQYTLYSDCQVYGTMYSDDYSTFMVQFTVIVQYTVHLWYNVKWWSILLYIYGTMYSDGPVYCTFMCYQKFPFPPIIKSMFCHNNLKKGWWGQIFRWQINFFLAVALCNMV